MNALLSRIVSVDSGTLGTFELSVKDKIILTLATIELPWRDNQPQISCIPADTYEVEWTYSNRFKTILPLLKGVYKRSGIRIHKGNWAGDASLGYPSQSQGCILIGMKSQIVLRDGRSQCEVIQSAIAMDQLRTKSKQQPFTLTIR